MKNIQSKKHKSGDSKRKAFIICGIAALGIIVAAAYIYIMYSVGAIAVGGKTKAERKAEANIKVSDNMPDTPPVTSKNSDTGNNKNSVSDNTNTNEDAQPNTSESGSDNSTTTVSHGKGIIVLDPGHGKSSSSMSKEEKQNDGWIYNSAKGGWGEWRHWKSGTTWQDCNGSGCTGRAPQNGGCWYPIGAGDRDKEPQINMNNVLAAKRYLEDMGYEVRLTRTDNSTNPSMTQRLKYCYPNNDTTQQPDADAFICVHSNAGGGRGSYYIALSGLYDQAGIPSDYITSGNALGQSINNRVVSETKLSAAGSNGRYDGYPTLVLFCKSPITIAYMEIGFFDNASDLAILNSSADQIGKAIAEGVDDYMSSSGKSRG